MRSCGNALLTNTPNDGAPMVDRIRKTAVHTYDLRRSSNWLLPMLGTVCIMNACNWNVTNPFADEGQLVSIAISGDSVVQVGDTIRVSAQGNVGGLTGLFSYDRVPDAVWAVSDPKTASIARVKLPANDTTSGSAIILTGLQRGNVQVTATARGILGTRGVQVVPIP